MSNKKNDEKLKILQERLEQIKKKQESPIISSKKEKKTSSTIEETSSTKPSKSSGWVKYVIIAGITVIIIIGGISVFFIATSEMIVEEKKEFLLEYNLDKLVIKDEMKQIAITGSFNNENAAKAMRNALRVKGYKSDYFFLPDHSNSVESPEPETLEIYKVFIGPYENQEETNQWTKKLDLEFEIISL